MNQEILNQVSFYMYGTREADSAKMKPAFHENATMYGFAKDGSVEAAGSIQVLYDIIDSIQPMPDMTTEATILEETANTASVKIELISEVSDIHWIDLMNVIKIDGEWKIVSKIYHSR